MNWKFLCLICAFLPISSAVGQALDFNVGFEDFLAAHNSVKGFDYEAVTSEELTALNDLLAQLNNIDFVAESTNIPLKINVYNFLVIREILANYPIASVAEINDFFGKKLKVGTGKLSLDELEKNIIYTGKNPYLHFLLNCGAKGCPRLQFISPEQKTEGYIKAALEDKHLIEAAEKKTFLSQIFFWNMEEFGDEKKIIAELNRISDKKILSRNPISYMEYDWLLNSRTVGSNQTFYPTKLYSKGGGELKIFNNYYAQNESGFRSNFFSSFFQVLLGTNKNLNFGIDLKVRSVTNGNVSMFSALNFQNKPFHSVDGTESFARVGISGVGPRIKYQPFKSKNNINVLHTLYFVPMESAQGNNLYGYSDYNYFQIFNQLFYEKEFSVKRRLFIDFGILIENIKLTSTQADHFMPIQVPVTAIYSYFPDTKMTLYALASFGQRLDIVYPSDAASYTNYTVYGQLGGGFKYYLTDYLEVELLYTNFIDTTPGRRANTFNLGLRFFRF